MRLLCLSLGPERGHWTQSWCRVGTGTSQGAEDSEAASGLCSVSSPGRGELGLALGLLLVCCSWFLHLQDPLQVLQRPGLDFHKMFRLEEGEVDESSVTGLCRMSLSCPPSLWGLLKKHSVPGLRLGVTGIWGSCCSAPLWVWCGRSPTAKGSRRLQMFASVLTLQC